MFAFFASDIVMWSVLKLLSHQSIDPQLLSTYFKSIFINSISEFILYSTTVNNVNDLPIKIVKIPVWPPHPYMHQIPSFSPLFPSPARPLYQSFRRVNLDTAQVLVHVHVHVYPRFLPRVSPTGWDKARRTVCDRIQMREWEVRVWEVVFEFWRRVRVISKDQLNKIINLVKRQMCLYIS